MISLAEILMGRVEFNNLPADLQANCTTLLDRINQVRTAYGKPMTVNSGYRTPEINEATANAAAHSWHLKCAAVDIGDADGALWAWVLDNLELMQSIGLWCEDKRWCPTWTHFQIFPSKSGHRIFVPSSAPAKAPDVWDGTYDHSFD